MTEVVEGVNFWAQNVDTGEVQMCQSVLFEIRMIGIRQLLVCPDAFLFLYQL